MTLQKNRQLSSAEAVVAAVRSVFGMTLGCHPQHIGPATESHPDEHHVPSDDLHVSLRLPNDTVQAIGLRLAEVRFDLGADPIAAAKCIASSIARNTQARAPRRTGEISSLECHRFASNFGEFDVEFPSHA